MILIPNDLRVTIRSSCLVYPSLQLQEQLETNKSFFLSNIDQVVNFDVQTVHFFRAYGEGEGGSLFPLQVVAEKLKNALENVLVSYDFLGGRLATNPLTGRLEIDCNRTGAGFVVANSDLSLDEIGDLVYPNPAFGQLAIQTLDSIDHHHHKPLCIVQVTSFKCGGFVIGISNNHATFDGISFKAFLENLAALACSKPLAVTPCHDRHLLAARSPPRVTFPHPELVKLTPDTAHHHHHQDQDRDSSSSNPPILLDTTQETLDFHIFRLASVDIAALKDKASRGGGMEARVSGFNAITAHVWRCKALSCDASNYNTNKNNLAVAVGADADRLSRVLFAVDVRARLSPPLPPSYAGNAILTSHATATYRELEEGPLSRLVDMVKEGAKRMTNEYARSVIDWGEMNKGYPQGELLVSSWLKLGFAEVEYPWGRPTYCCPVVSPRKDLVLLFPDIDDKDGVNVLVSLPTNQMDKFQTLFRMLL